MGKSIANDLLRDNNFRYFFRIFVRLKRNGIFKVTKEFLSYYQYYTFYPIRISGELPDYKYKLFVVYNYFKIVAIHPNISKDDLLKYFPTRLQKYFIYKLDPKEKRIITNDKIIFYKRLRGANLPFPTVLFYIRNGQRLTLNDEELICSNINWPDKLFVKPINENGGANAGVIKTKDIDDVQEGFIVQKLAINHPDIIRLAGSYAFNTIRIISYIDNAGKTNILSAIFRLSKGKQVDNWGKGSINVRVNIEDGSLGKIGVTKRYEKFERHPAGEFDFDGFKIPHWEKLIDIVYKGSKVFSELRFIAWDIGITSEGPEIIEANSGCDFFHAQLFQPYDGNILMQDLLNGK